MSYGTIEFKGENLENALKVVKVLLGEGYEVLLTQDEMGNISIGYNKVDWTDKSYTLISFREIDLLQEAKEKGEENEE